MLADGGELIGRAVVLATGHSARDVYELLGAAGVRLEAKPFALGVRIEHPQPLIDRIQYGRAAGHPKLPAAPYRLAFTPDDERGVFSFCMCPGGLIVPAATEPDGLVVNGMSLSRRDSPYANSGLVVAVELARSRSARARAAARRRRAPARARARGGAGRRRRAARAGDARDRLRARARRRSTVPATSYQPGLAAGDVGEVLDAIGAAARRSGCARRSRAFDRQMRGYLTEDAVLVGVESRTSLAGARPARLRRRSSRPDLRRALSVRRGRGLRGRHRVAPRSTACASRARSPVHDPDETIRAGRARADRRSGAA